MSKNGKFTPKNIKAKGLIVFLFIIVLIILFVVIAILRCGQSRIKHKLKEDNKNVFENKKKKSK